MVMRIKQFMRTAYISIGAVISCVFAMTFFLFQIWKVTILLLLFSVNSGEKWFRNKEWQKTHTPKSNNKYQISRLHNSERNWNKSVRDSQNSIRQTPNYTRTKIFVQNKRNIKTVHFGATRKNVKKSNEIKRMKCSETVSCVPWIGVIPIRRLKQLRTNDIRQFPI